MNKAFTSIRDFWRGPKMNKFVNGLVWFGRSFIWLGIILLAIDVATKNIVIYYKESILPNGIDLIPGFLRINYVINTHVAFGQGFDNLVANRVIFIILAILISAFIVGYLVKNWKKTGKFYRAVAFMVIAGALGNAIDRIFYTAEYLGVEYPGVVDWIDFYGVWQWNFNIADSCVVIAAFMLIISLIVDVIKEKIEAKKAEPKEAQPVEKIVSKSEKEIKELREKNKENNE